MMHRCLADFARIGKMRPLLFVLSVSGVLLLFLGQGHIGFNLWDEGFFWYGASHVLKGEVPLRDFMAYDPGRYYWSAAFMTLFGGDSIMDVRTAAAFFQVFGVFAGLTVVSKALPNSKTAEQLLFLVLLLLTLLMWMAPRHKLFDVSLALCSIAALAFLLEKPTRKRFFVTGIYVGMAAVFGKNHGLYAALGTLAGTCWVYYKGKDLPPFLKAASSGFGGVLVGYSPIFLFCLFIPGFWISFRDSVLSLFEQGTTNLPLPVPWPWKTQWASLPFESALPAFLTGIFFVGLLLFAAGSLSWCVYSRHTKRTIPPGLAAAAFLSIPYAHYAFSRADLGHLAHGIYPLLIGLFIAFCRLPSLARFVASFLLWLASVAAMFAYHPGGAYLLGGQWEKTTVSNDSLVVPGHIAKEIAFLRELNEKHAPQKEHNILVTPFWPSAYPLLGKPSPIWEIYALWPRSPEFEQKEIERIRKAEPGFVVVIDLPLDGREGLRYPNTHPQTYQYIIDNYKRVESNFSPYVQVFTPGL